MTPEMEEFYAEMLRMIGAEYIRPFGKRGIVVRLSCGHEKTYNRSAVYGFKLGTKPRCAECRMINLRNKMQKENTR